MLQTNQKHWNAHREGLTLRDFFLFHAPLCTVHVYLCPCFPYSLSAWSDLNEFSSEGQLAKIVANSRWCMLWNEIQRLYE